MTEGFLSKEYSYKELKHICNEGQTCDCPLCIEFKNNLNKAIIGWKKKGWKLEDGVDIGFDKVEE